MAESMLTLEDRVALKGWLDSGKIPMDSDTREYFIQECERRNISFGLLISTILHVVADDDMVSAILD